MALQENKHLTFMIGKEVYGLPILKVTEIIGMMKITHVPGMPEYVKGVINLRGKIIPTLDLRLKFGLESREYDDKTSIIVVEINKDGNSHLSGLIVDTVSEVLDIEEENIELPPTYGNDINSEFISGIGKKNDKVIIILNADKIIMQKDAEKVLNLNNEA